MLLKWKNVEFCINPKRFVNLDNSKHKLEWELWVTSRQSYKIFYLIKRIDLKLCFKVNKLNAYKSYVVPIITHIYWNPSQIYMQTFERVQMRASKWIFEKSCCYVCRLKELEQLLLCFSIEKHYLLVLFWKFKAGLLQKLNFFWTFW